MSGLRERGGKCSCKDGKLGKAMGGANQELDFGHGSLKCLFDIRADVEEAAGCVSLEFRGNMQAEV